jgi:uncharacterized membrane protein
LIRRRRWPRIVAAVLVAPIATLIFSIGLFYVPAIALMGIAAMAPPPVDWAAEHARAQAQER